MSKWIETHQRHCFKTAYRADIYGRGLARLEADAARNNRKIIAVTSEPGWNKRKSNRLYVRYKRLKRNKYRRALLNMKCEIGTHMVYALYDSPARARRIALPIEICVLAVYLTSYHNIREFVKNNKELGKILSRLHAADTIWWRLHTLYEILLELTEHQQLLLRQEDVALAANVGPSAGKDAAVGGGGITSLNAAVAGTSTSRAAAAAAAAASISEKGANLNRQGSTMEFSSALANAAGKGQLKTTSAKSAATAAVAAAAAAAAAAATETSTAPEEQPAAAAGGVAAATMAALEGGLGSAAVSTYFTPRKLRHHVRWTRRQIRIYLQRDRALWRLNQAQMMMQMRARRLKAQSKAQLEKLKSLGGKLDLAGLLKKDDDSSLEQASGVRISAAAKRKRRERKRQQARAERRRKKRHDSEHSAAAATEAVIAAAAAAKAAAAIHATDKAMSDAAHHDRALGAQADKLLKMLKTHRAQELIAQGYLGRYEHWRSLISMQGEQARLDSRLSTSNLTELKWKHEDWDCAAVW